MATDPQKQFVNRFAEKTNTDVALLLFFMTVAAAMYVEAESFSNVSAQFPQMLAGVILVFGTAILLRDHIAPRFTNSSVEELTAEGENSKLGDEAQAEANERPIIDLVIFTASVGGFVVLAYLVGLLWAGPLYVLFYLRWRKKPWSATVGLALLILLLGEIFVRFLNVNLKQGLLLFAGVS